MTPHDDRQGGSIQGSVAKLLDGELSGEEFAELAERLREDPEAREEYFECVSLETNLDHVYTPPLSRSGHGHSGQSAAVRKQFRWALGIAAAAAVVIASVMWVIQTRQPEPGTIALRLCEGSRWVVEGALDPSGSTLVPGAKLRIEQGVAELNLPDEVRAVVEGPAAMVLVDDRTLQLDQGRAFFEVSSVEGRGFTVVTQRQRIVDLGTAFGVDARTGRDGVELHVFEGRVRVDDLAGGKGEIIKANRSVLLDGARVERELDGPRTAFLRKLPPKVETVFEEDFESGLVGGRDYAVRIDPSAIRDLAGNRFRGIDDDKTWNFTTPLRGPVGQVLASFDLGRGSPVVSGDVPAASNPNGLQFTGTVGTWANISIETPSATNNGVTLTFDSTNGWGNTIGDRGAMGAGAVRIYPDITTGDIPWTITELTPNAFYDMIWFNKRESPGENRVPNSGVTGFDAGNGVGASVPLDADRDQNFVGVQADATGTISGTWFLAGGEDGITAVAGVQIGISGAPDVVPPSVARLAPGNGAIDVPAASRLAVTFSESVRRGTGDIVIREPAGGAVLETIPITSERIGIRSSVLTIQPASDPGTGCSIEIAAGAVKDLAGNSFAGMTGEAAWSFLREVPTTDVSPPSRGEDDSPPVVTVLHPADDPRGVVPGSHLEMTFDEPVKLGTGRFFIRGTTDWIESVVVVGDPRLSVDGRTLTITPPATLADGSISMGWVGNWAADTSAGLLNPIGDGTRYADEGLKDKGRGRGMIGAMRGPIMATFSRPQPYSRIRHDLGTITPDSRYTVSAAIGVRNENATVPAAFLGYTIRLVSGDAVLAELADDTPPGPPNSVTTVGFSWDSSTLPEGVSSGDPLAIEIAPNRTTGPGYLDLDHVRVTSCDRR